MITFEQTIPYAKRVYDLGALLKNPAFIESDIFNRLVYAGLCTQAEFSLLSKLDIAKVWALHNYTIMELMIENDALKQGIKTLSLELEAACPASKSVESATAAESSSSSQPGPIAPTARATNAMAVEQNAPNSKPGFSAKSPESKE